MLEDGSIPHRFQMGISNLKRILSHISFIRMHTVSSHIFTCLFIYLFIFGWIHKKKIVSYGMLLEHIHVDLSGVLSQKIKN